jgi:hypothetical protein
VVADHCLSGLRRHRLALVVAQQARADQKLVHDREWHEVQFVQHLVEPVEFVGLVPRPAKLLGSPCHELTVERAGLGECDAAILMGAGQNLHGVDRQRAARQVGGPKALIEHDDGRDA